MFNEAQWPFMAPQAHLPMQFTAPPPSFLPLPPVNYVPRPNYGMPVKRPCIQAPLMMQNEMNQLAHPSVIPQQLQNPVRPLPNLEDKMIGLLKQQCTHFTKNLKDINNKLSVESLEELKVGMGNFMTSLDCIHSYVNTMEHETSQTPLRQEIRTEVNLPRKQLPVCHQFTKRMGITAQSKLTSIAPPTKKLVQIPSNIKKVVNSNSSETTPTFRKVVDPRSRQSWPKTAHRQAQNDSDPTSLKHKEEGLQNDVDDDYKVFLLNYRRAKNLKEAVVSKRRHEKMQRKLQELKSRGYIATVRQSPTGQYVFVKSQQEQADDFTIDNVPAPKMYIPKSLNQSEESTEAAADNDSNVDIQLLVDMIAKDDRPFLSELERCSIFESQAVTQSKHID